MSSDGGESDFNEFEEWWFDDRQELFERPDGPWDSHIIFEEKEGSLYPHVPSQDCICSPDLIEITKHNRKIYKHRRVQ